jgi:hypothetical protein
MTKQLPSVSPPLGSISPENRLWPPDWGGQVDFLAKSPVIRINRGRQVSQVPIATGVTCHS